MSMLSRIKSALGLEGSYRGPAPGYSHWGTPFGIDIGDGYQAGLTIARHDARNVPAVYACVMATAKAVSACWPRHMVVVDGAAEKSLTSPASRVLKKPNTTETWPQFILNAVCQMLFDGECFILLSRDARGAMTAMNRMPRGTCNPYVESGTGTVFYAIGQNPVMPSGMSYMAPARDVCHLRMHTPRHELMGESPITAAALAIGVNVALSANQATFFNQMSRPSGILSTDQVLTKDQMLQLRTAFEEQSKGMGAGRIPVLGSGIVFSPMGISSQDSQLVEAQRMSVEEIARVFAVPLPIIGDLSHATLNNTETLINHWLATGLGSVIENIERSFDAAFGLTGEDYIELDVSSLLRMDFEARINGYVKAVQGGIMTPEEARNKEYLPSKKGDDALYMQQQMVPLDTLAELHNAELSNKLKPTPAPAAPKPVDPPAPSGEAAKAMVIDMFNRKRS